MKKLLVVDSNSILNRAYYGIRPLTTKEGVPTNAVYGYVNILKKHIDALEPDYTACAFDLHAPTFRHKMYDGYKANRKPMPDDLRAQMPWAHKVAEAMGLTVVEKEGYEADDVLGTLAAMGDKEGIETYLLTGDRDSLQLITRTTSVILVKTKEDIIYTPEAFRSEYGITPDAFVDVKALMGDSSDNIPGVAGIGEKTALKLIAQCGSLDGLYADPDFGGAGKSAKEKIENGRDMAYLSKELATIMRDAPLGVALSDLEYHGPVAKELIDLFTKLEFSAFLKRFNLSEDNAPVNSADCPELCEISSLPEVFAIDVAGDAVYIADEKSISRLSGYLLTEALSKKVICHNYKSLCRKLSALGLPIPDCAFDTMSAAYLLSPGESSYPIDKTVLRYLSEQYQDKEGSVAWYSVRTYPVIEKLLREADMLDLLLDVEIPLSPVLAKMEENGFYLDTAGLMDYVKELAKVQGELAERIYFAAGKEFNLNSPKQLGEVLFEILAIPHGKKTKTGWKTDAETLSELKYDYPIVEDILDYRQVAKLIGTYGENLAALADENGKIHTTFNQTGTATGRLSSADPNMQNIPVRAELGRELRKFFTASDKDHILIDADYSQIELRLLAVMSGDENMKNSFLSGNDFHASTAAKVFGVAPENVTKTLRSKAKAVNFGVVYGIGAFSLSKDINVSVKEAKAYIDSYFRTFPQVDAYLRGVVSDAKRDGYQTTLYKRRRPIPELKAQNANLRAFGERVAMNSPIQGTAADIIKLAMINVSKAFDKEGIDAKLILQVHDELIVEASLGDADRAEEILKYEMEHVLESDVPLVAEAQRGFSWYEAK